MPVDSNVTGAQLSHQNSSTTPHNLKRTYHRKRLVKQDDIDTVLVVNPNSSSGLTGKGWSELYSQIREALGVSVKVALTKKPGDGSILARKFLKQGFKKVVAIGGDGTLNEVANGFFEDPVGIHSNKIDTVSGFPALKPINPDAIMGVITLAQETF